MKNILSVTGISFILVALVSFAAEKNWTGKISDSMCGASHAAMAHEGKKINDHDCTVECVKGGSRYVLVSQGKVLDIENQDFAELKEHAGHSVKVTGEMSADNKRIKVSKIEVVGTREKAKGSKT